MATEYTRGPWTDRQKELRKAARQEVSYLRHELFAEGATPSAYIAGSMARAAASYAFMAHSDLRVEECLACNGSGWVNQQCGPFVDEVACPCQAEATNGN